MQQLLENMGKIRIAAVEANKLDLESFSSSCEIKTCQDAADPTERDLQRHLMSSAAEIFDTIMPQVRIFPKPFRYQLRMIFEIFL